MNWFAKLFGGKDVDLSGPREKFIEHMEGTTAPWASFEIVDFAEDGQVKVEFNWNKKFIERLDELGFTAETEQDTVQMFFYASQMQPTELNEVSGDESVHVADLPNLSDNVNKF